MAELLKEIIHKPGLRINGRTIARESVRGIIPSGQKLLMVYVAKNGGYKFPGGGIRSDETHEAALRREIQEESGAALTRIESFFGAVVEYHVPIERDYDVFRKTSSYYGCRVDNQLGACHLEPDEQELGFTPAWIDVEAAIRANALLVHGKGQSVPQWAKRELYVLRQVQMLTK